MPWKPERLRQRSDYGQVEKDLATILKGKKVVAGRLKVMPWSQGTALHEND